MWLGYKLFYRTKLIPYNAVDLTSGLKAIEDEEKRFLEQEAAKGSRSGLKRIWDSL